MSSAPIVPSDASELWAEQTAERYLGQLGHRWDHTRSVAARAAALRTTVSADDAHLLIAAGWLHDIGYAPDVADTGFHPLDGARFLESRGTNRRLVNLVANHSCARFEADERDLLPELAQYELEVGPVADALVFADMTTGPTGRTVTVEERLEEILRRYKPNSPVHRAISEASGELEAAVSRVEQRLARML